MEQTKSIINNLLNSNPNVSLFFKRNLIKEYLQVLVLDCLYSHHVYSGLIFYGGSCLAHCFDLPRLSEDLDFVDINKKINLNGLATDLKNFFEKNTDLKPIIKVQKFRLYLKFPILKDLNLTEGNESDWLFLKIEIFKEFNCSNYQTEIKPLFKYNRSILIKIFDLPTLMATKIQAILHRKWKKIDKSGQITIMVKGRDYFDLMWYLEKKVEPNLDCLAIAGKQELKNKLLIIIDKLDVSSVILDLENFISDKDFVANLGKNIKAILKSQVKKW